MYAPVGNGICLDARGNRYNKWMGFDLDTASSKGLEHPVYGPCASACSSVKTCLGFYIEGGRSGCNLVGWQMSSSDRPRNTSTESWYFSRGSVHSSGTGAIAKASGDYGSFCYKGTHCPFRPLLKT